MPNWQVSVSSCSRYLTTGLLGRDCQSLVGVTSVVLCNRPLPVDFRYAPLATEIAWRCNMSRWAKSRSLPPTVRTACYTPSVHVGAAGTSPSWHNPYKD
jgi:hypothetical protein